LHFYVRCSRSVKKRGLTPQAAEAQGFSILVIGVDLL
jgi:hypothetical protein